MAGRGPTPKDPAKRARRNGDPVSQTTLRAEVVEAPPLPARYEDYPEVAEWWQTWVDSPQADLFSSTDWQYLRDTLPLVRAYHYDENGLKHAGEIRLRVAQFGATPADRARLRMTFAQADEADRKRPAGETGESRARYGGLRAVQGGQTR